jgi:hypothetical protein
MNPPIQLIYPNINGEKKFEVRVVVHAYNSSIQEAEAGRL